ncbi:Myb domain protein 62 [Tanacetum coccineum]
MQDEELHVEETRNSISPSQSHGRRVTTKNQEEQYLHEHYHEYETRNSFSPTQSHGRRVRIDTNEAYRQEQHHEGDSIQTETYMSDDEYEEENTGSTSHVTRKEARAFGKTRKSRLNKGNLVFEYVKLDGTTWKKQLDLLKTDIFSKITMLPEFCLEQFTTDLKIYTTNLLGLLKMTWNLWSENSDFDFKCTRMRSAMSSQLGYQHRNHQYKLHIHYKEYETMEEAMTHPSKGIEVSDWVLLCERFASEDFQKISEKNKKNRAKNLVPPTVGTRSLARRVDESRREGKEVSEIEQYKMAHYSKRLKGMINEEADTIWNDLQTEEATSSCTSAEICLKKLGHLPGHIKGRSASTKQILETVNLRSELKALKEENKATNEKVDYLLEEMKKMAQLLQQFQTRDCIVRIASASLEAIIQTETCMSDDEDEEENIGSTSHVTRKETRALGETRKSRLNKGSLVFEVDESFGRIIGKNSQGFITKGGCVMRKYAKLDGTTWKKQPDLLKTDIISKTTMLPEFCLEQFTADLKICTTNLLGLLKMTWNLWSVCGRKTLTLTSSVQRMEDAYVSQLGYQHRNHQYKLHIHYKEYETMEEAMTHPPKGIEVSDWVLLCERFASEDFQKISEKNKKNRSKNLVPPTVGTRSLARRVDESRREGKEVSEIEQYKMAHYSKKLKGMINEEADTIWNDLQTEEATSSCTSAEICLKKLGHLPGHIKGRSASNKQILETVNLRSELKALKEENKATNEKVDYLLEEMKKMAQLLQQFQTRVFDNARSKERECELLYSDA